MGMVETVLLNISSREYLNAPKVPKFPQVRNVQLLPIGSLSNRRKHRDHSCPYPWIFPMDKRCLWRFSLSNIQRILDRKFPTSDQKKARVNNSFLPAKIIIHMMLPIWSSGERSSDWKLFNCPSPRRTFSCQSENDSTSSENAAQSLRSKLLHSRKFTYCFSIMVFTLCPQTYVFARFWQY